MKKQQVLQWKLMEVLLPELKETLNKWEESKIVLRKVEETERKIEQKKNILSSIGTCSMTVLHQILEEISDAEMENKVVREKYDKLKRDLSEENMFYMNLAHFFDGMNITKTQVTFDEFQAILYFAWVTGIDRTQLFECFDAMYPHITHAWDKKIENI